MSIEEYSAIEERHEFDELLHEYGIDKILKRIVEYFIRF